MSENPHADEEAKHRRYERIVGSVTLIATLCAAGFAGGAYLQAKRQADIAQTALIESDHPFLELGIQKGAEVHRDGKTYVRVTLNIKNQGSRPAALQYAEFAIVNEGAAEEALSAMSKTGLVGLVVLCAPQIIRKVIPVAGTISTEFRSQVPVVDRVQQNLVGGFVYSGQLGTAWRQTVNRRELTSGEWADFRPAFDFETRIERLNREP
ncbi:hypothetical protein FV242_01750 [Methylobacterium sp. WL64]|uniref:hypothetical protein n=1 Tax=Methylobacterium sp. WL64 TaxID=2603894 RepID=UPI0011C98AD3|nr:hypothetical protein [Methylobacterium sp. WL64]TXN05921.1 hypothetical protein FV242_01750 [Methylobacterium sp. WL64]